MLQTAEIHVEDISEHETGKIKRCRPFALQKRILISFAITFVGLILALQMLLYVSQRDGGIVTVTNQNHYLWTYGPTACFIVLSAAWYRVDYAARRSMPWFLLGHGPTVAEETVLLDYISPAHPLCLFGALKHSHFAVALPMICTNLLQLSAIISTSLLVQSSVLRNEAGALQIMLTTKFDGTHFNQSYNGSAQDADSSNSFISAAPIVRAAGAIQANLTWPAWSSDEFAFQSFASLLHDNGTILANIEAFQGDLGPCETGNVSYWQAVDEQFYASFISPTCSYQYQLPDPGNVTGVSGELMVITCANASDSRLLLYVQRATNGSTLPDNASFLICIPTYEIKLVDVTTVFDVEGTALDVVVLPGYSTSSLISKPIPNIAVQTITLGLLDSLTLFYNYNPTSAASRPSPDSFVSLMVTQNLNLTVNEYMNPNLLETQAQNLFRALSGQFALSYLTTSVNQTSLATLRSYQSRLVVRELAAMLMTATLAVSIALIVITMALVPSDTLVRSGSIISHMSVLLSSHDFLGLFKRDDGRSWLKVRSKVGEYQYKMALPCLIESKIVACICKTSTRYPREDLAHENDDEVDNVPDRFWTPLGLTPSMLCMWLLLPILLIAALEILLQQSRKNRGLATVNDGAYMHYLWTSLPALVMVLIGISCASVASSLKLLQPFQRPSATQLLAEDCLVIDYLAMLDLEVIFKATRRKHWAVTMASLATLLAPLLTIVVSGLYTAQPVTGVLPLQLQRLDLFNSTAVENLTSGVGNTANLVGAFRLDLNYTESPWTSGDMVLASVGLERNSSAEGQTISVMVPGIRSRINCMAMPLNLSNWRSPDTEEEQNSNIYFEIDVPEGCGFKYEINAYDEGYEYTANAKTDFFAGWFTAPNTGYFGGAFWPSNEDIGCPGAFIIVGHELDNITDATVAVTCQAPYAQSLNVSATFGLPDFDLLSAVPLEKSATTLCQLGYQPKTLPIILETADNEYLDPFASAILHHSGGDIDSLFNGTFLARQAEQVYAILATQQIDMNARTATTSSSDDDNSIPNSNVHVSATLLDAITTRLFQNCVSTRILQGLLAAIVVCSLVALSTMRVRNVVPVPPTTIGAIAYLLVAYDMLDECREKLPLEAVWMSDKELRGLDLFERRNERSIWRPVPQHEIREDPVSND